MKNPGLLTLFQILFLSSNTVFVVAQRNCSEGFFKGTDGICKECPFGTVQIERNKCEPCPVGMFGIAKGRVFRFSEGVPFFSDISNVQETPCRFCPPGTFNDAPGATSCKPCPAGTASGSNFTKCVTCGKGTRVSAYPFIRNPCTRCEKNTFSDGVSNQVCENCPLGTVSDVGASECSKCPKGTYRRTTQKCQPCAAGTFSDEKGSTFCKICPTGTFSRKGAEKCTSCQAGLFASHIASSGCRKCPPGTTSMGIKAAGCKNASGRCPFDTFRNRDGECEACIPGHKLDVKAKKCLPCAANEISAGGVITSCEKCPADKEPAKGFGLRDGAECICKAGTALPRYPVPLDRVCRPCGPLEVADWDEEETSGAPNVGGIEFGYERQCISCLFSDRDFNDPACDPCPLGTILLRDDTCEKCPTGSIARSVHNLFHFDNRRIHSGACVDKETGCFVGSSKRKGECKLESCPPGSFFERKLFRGCVRCLPGNFISPRQKCAPCNPNRISPGGVSLRCTKCPNCRLGQGSRCVCPPGTEEVRGVCKPCATGEANNVPDGRCAPCPPGSISKREGQARCVGCPPDSVTSSVGSTKCVKCPKGSQSGQDFHGNRVHRCVPKDPYEENPDLLAKLRD